MATRKPKRREPLTLNGSQARIALDLLGRWKTECDRFDLYESMSRRNGVMTAHMVRFVDQETRKEVLDVPAETLRDNAKAALDKINAELEMFCGIKVERK